MSTEDILFHLCQKMYVSAAGDYWYEKGRFIIDFKYKMFHYGSFIIFHTLVISEILASLFGDFSADADEFSAYMLTAVHGIVLSKMIMFNYKKESIKILNYEMVEICRQYEDKVFLEKLAVKVKRVQIWHFIGVYMTVISYGVESLRKTIFEGVPFYTVVTLWPKLDDASILGSTIRVMFYLSWLYMMFPMVWTDCHVISILIILANKFITLGKYFDNIGLELMKESKLKNIADDDAEERFRIKFIKGISMHQKLMQITDMIRDCFGLIMSLQVCESSAVAVLLLLRLALAPVLTLTNLLSTAIFVGSLFLLLALFIWNAGEITYQASLLPENIFCCGWYACKPRKCGKDVRHLVLLSCVQAQRPLVLKAFRIQDLSYETYLSVVKMTYSVFTVFYQRK